MSSNAYFAEFQPDSVLRQAVLWSGAVLASVGVPVIAVLPLPVGVRLAGVALWAFWSLRELIALRRAFQACLGLRFAHDGAVGVLEATGEWRPGQLAPGGILLRKWGWIRIQMASGRVFAEPLRGQCRESQDWRRLQVIWRHVGASE